MMPLLLEIVGNKCIEIVYGIINFQINLTFLMKPLFYMTKNSRQNFKYLQNEKSF